MGSYSHGNYSYHFSPHIPDILPFNRIYVIQVGYKAFKLSGASLSSDAPSYFTDYFSLRENNERTLFIDRDPKTFEYIYEHLQGYSIAIKDAYDYVKIWMDSVYFGLSQLQDFLMKAHLYVIVGEKSFKVAREFLYSEGNSPNLFTLTYDTISKDTKRMMASKPFLRPPPLLPPMALNRSAVLFEDILECSKGNMSVIRDDEHRKILLQECSYYSFLELRQRLIKHKILPSPISIDEQEIIINVFDLSREGLRAQDNSGCMVPFLYKRPYLNEPHRILLTEISECVSDDAVDIPAVKLGIESPKLVLVTFGGSTADTISSIIEGFGDAFDSQKKDSSGHIFLTFPVDLMKCKIKLNGKDVKEGWINTLLNKDEEDDVEESEKKKRRLEDNQNRSSEGPFILSVSKSLWRILIQETRILFQAVQINLHTEENDSILKRLEFL